MGTPAGATMASTRAGSSPLATRLCLSTAALRVLATNQRCLGCRANAALRACRSRRPCVATMANPAAGSSRLTSAGSSVESTVAASGWSCAVAPGATTATEKPTRGARIVMARATGESPNTIRRGAGSTGSTNSSSVPPEWQAMPNSRTSSSSRSAVSSVGVILMVRGCPSANAWRTVLMTAGWAQPPPIQPWIMPSAVTSALSPGRADVGGCTRSTDTRAKGCCCSCSRVAALIHSVWFMTNSWQKTVQ